MTESTGLAWTREGGSSECCWLNWAPGGCRRECFGNVSLLGPIRLVIVFLLQIRICSLEKTFSVLHFTLCREYNNVLSPCARCVPYALGLAVSHCKTQNVLYLGI